MLKSSTASETNCIHDCTSLYIIKVKPISIQKKKIKYLATCYILLLLFLLLPLYQDSTFPSPPTQIMCLLIPISVSVFFSLPISPPSSPSPFFNTVNLLYVCCSSELFLQFFSHSNILSTLTPR